MPKKSLRDPGFGSRLARLIKERATNQRQLALKLGVTAGSVNRWILGEAEPGSISNEQIAEALGVPVSRVATDDAPPQEFSAEGRRYAAFKREAHRIAAGQAIDWPVDRAHPVPTYAFSLEWFRRRFGIEPADDSRRFQVWRIAEDERGDSMEPTIPRGSVVLTDADAAQKEGAIYVVRDPEQGGFMVKRVYRTRDGLVFESDNRAHRSIVVRMDPDRSWDGARKFVVGKVVWVGFDVQ